MGAFIFAFIDLYSLAFLDSGHKVTFLCLLYSACYECRKTFSECFRQLHIGILGGSLTLPLGIQNSRLVLTMAF